MNLFIFKDTSVFTGRVLFIHWNRFFWLIKLEHSRLVISTTFCYYACYMNLKLDVVSSVKLWQYMYKNDVVWFISNVRCITMLSFVDRMKLLLLTISSRMNLKVLISFSVVINFFSLTKADHEYDNQVFENSAQNSDNYYGEDPDSLRLSIFHICKMKILILKKLS